MCLTFDSVTRYNSPWIKASNPAKIDQFRLKNDLPILVSYFYLLRDERKGRDSARVKGRKKRGREDSDPNGIGL